ncbi:MAG: hypothetical protein ABDH28_01570 [Brevinematia bacterium]
MRRFHRKRQSSLLNIRKSFFSIAVFCFLLTLVTLSAVSCSRGIRGKFLTYLEIGTNTNQFHIWIPYHDSNFVFYSFQEIFSSSVDPEIKNFLDDSFSVTFIIDSAELLILNQVPKKLRLLSTSYNASSLVDEVNLEKDFFITDSTINSEGSMLLLAFDSETSLGDCLYSAFFYKKGSGKVENVGTLFTNVVKLDSDDLGNFYIFQNVSDSHLRIDMFSSAFLALPPITVNLEEFGMSNVVFSSGVVLKPLLFLLKFDSKDLSQKSFILLLDYNSKRLLKKYEISLPSGNFAMLSLLKNNFVACATFKNGLPVIMFFNPFEPYFKVSHEIYIEFPYPTMMRGFRVEKDGRLIASFLDVPDNKILFYYWDLISAK